MWACPQACVWGMFQRRTAAVLRPHRRSRGCQLSTWLTQSGEPSSDAANQRPGLQRPRPHPSEQTSWAPTARPTRRIRSVSHSSIYVSQNSPAKICCHHEISLCLLFKNRAANNSAGPSLLPSHTDGRQHMARPPDTTVRSHHHHCCLI